MIPGFNYVWDAKHGLVAVENRFQNTILLQIIIHKTFQHNLPFVPQAKTSGKIKSVNKDFLF